MDNNNSLKRPSLHLNDFILQYITMTSNVFQDNGSFYWGGGEGKREGEEFEQKLKFEEQGESW